MSGLRVEYDTRGFTVTRGFFPLELEPGNIAVFTGFTPHRSGPNTSDRWRRQLFLSYNKLSDGGEQRDKHYAEFHQRWRARLATQGVIDLYFE